MPKISVIIPVYNVDTYLEQCLESIIVQTFANLEIILINDGSTDQSAKICEDYKAKDYRITVVHQKNVGVSSARNAGINIATGDYITFVDSDDWLETIMYSEMINVAKNIKDADVIMCDFVNIKNGNKENISVDIRNGYYTKKEIVSEIYPTLLVTENLGRIPIVSACTCLFRKELLIDNQINFNVDLRFSEDYLFMADVMLKANSFYYVKGKYFYNYRQYQSSRSKKYQTEWWFNFITLNTKLKELVSNYRDDNFSRQLKLQMLHSAVFLCNALYQDKNMKDGEKVLLMKQLFNDSRLSEVFYDLRLNHQKIGLKITLYLVRCKMPRSYLFYNKLMSTYYKIRNLYK